MLVLSSAMRPGVSSPDARMTGHAPASHVPLDALLALSELLLDSLAPPASERPPASEPSLMVEKDSAVSDVLDSVVDSELAAALLGALVDVAVDALALLLPLLLAVDGEVLLELLPGEEPLEPLQEALADVDALLERLLEVEVPVELDRELELSPPSAALLCGLELHAACEPVSRATTASASRMTWVLRVLCDTRSIGFLPLANLPR